MSRTATLELTPVDAQKIALGQQLGQLSLVLRKPGEEQNIPNVETVSLDDLRYSYYGSQPPPTAGVKPAAARDAAGRAAAADRPPDPAASRAGSPGRSGGTADQHGDRHPGDSGQYL